VSEATATAANPISIAEARRRVLAEVRAGAPEAVPLLEALGRVLAEEVRAPHDVPPFDNSAMDGYAVAAGAEGELVVTGEARAGSPWPAAVAAGTAVRISTGAPVPAGTGAVVPLERAPERYGRVVVAAVEPGANVRRAGEDARAGETVLDAGHELDPAALGVIASTGRASADCARRPLVALLATGDELTPPGEPLAPGRIWSSNPVALAGQVRQAGGDVESLETVADDREATRAALAGSLARADVVCVSGGVSVGPHDHVRAALADLGVEERFWRVALRPGKPTWFGVARGPSPVLAFGLPGNPVSAMVTFQLFVRPALRAIQGADPASSRARAVLAQPLPRNPWREEAVRCRLAAGDDGWRASPTGPQGSHVLTSMIAADALALVPAGEGELHAGHGVEVELLRAPAGLSSAP
jgi:molybdopterin molybdotransferase